MTVQGHARQLLRRRRQGSRPQCTGAELFNALLQSVLPLVQHALGKKLIHLNEQGGLPLAPPSEKYPKYRVHLLRTSGAQEQLHPSEVLQALELDVISLQVATRQRPIAIARRASVAPEAAAGPRASSSAEDATASEKPTRRTQNQILVVDIDAEVRVEFASDAFEFEVRGERWWTPTLGGLQLKHMKLRAHMRIWWNMLRSKLKVAFLPGVATPKSI